MADSPVPPVFRATRHWPDVPMKARTRRRIAIAVPLILVLAACAFTARWMYSDHLSAEPVEAVRAFLEASRSGDVEAALDWTTGETYAAEDLLVPEALSADWELLDLGLQDWSPFAASATVWATVKGPNATEVTTWFDLEELQDGWKVENPFAELAVETLPVPYLEVNGATVPIETAPFEGETFALLPGVYQLYPNPPELLAYEAEPLLALGDKLISADGTEDLYRADAFEGFTTTDDGEPELNERLTAYLDECMANPEGPEIFGCPFGLSESSIHYVPSDEHRWEIIEYPQVAVASFGPGVDAEGEIALLARQVGLARVTAVDTNSGTEHILECPIDAHGLYLVFDETGGYAIAPNNDPAAASADGTTWQDGYESWCEPV